MGSRHVGLAAGVVVALCATAACVQVLGYDDYRARPVDSVVDSAPRTDTEPVDVVDSGPPPLRPPPRPSGKAVPSGKGRTLWFAVRRYALGTVDAAGLDDEDAWKVQGYDVDELCTGPQESAANTGTCRRPPGASADSLLDGLRCRDNNFGRFVGVMIRAAAPASEKNLNDVVLSGSSTWIVRIDDVDATSDDPYAPAMFYRAGDERMSSVKMKWDGSDVRTVYANTVMDGDINKAMLTLPGGYITNNVWVSGDPAPLDLSVPLSASVFAPLTLRAARLTLELSPDRRSAINGIVSGVVRKGDVEASMRPVADNGMICPGSPIYVRMVESIAKMPDTTADHPELQDPTAVCDSVSLGIGYEVTPIQPVTRMVPPPPDRTSNCPDAGTD